MISDRIKNYLDTICILEHKVDELESGESTLKLRNEIKNLKLTIIEKNEQINSLQMTIARLGLEYGRQMPKLETVSIIPAIRVEGFDPNAPWPGA